MIDLKINYQHSFILMLFLGFSFNYPLRSQNTSKIITSDIDHFWNAYDQLANAHTKSDSIDILQKQYIDNASQQFRKFLKARKFTAEEYVATLSQYPGFWTSVRSLTQNIVHRTDEINRVLDELASTLPDFKRPDVCFAIGCLRTGGTTSRRLILVGSEIAAADTRVDKSGMDDWLQGVLGTTGDIVAMVAHEAVHTQQSGLPWGEFFSLIKHKRLTLLNMSIMEGSCDFITKDLLDLTINSTLHQYGEKHRDELIQEFKRAISENPYDYSQWLYNGNNAKIRPADLGYYLGYLISQAYYHRTENKTQALSSLLKRGKYKYVFKGSDLYN